MNTRKKQLLNKIETTLYIVIVVTMITDVWSGQTHPVIFIFSTIVLIAGMIGIISIELVKLKWKQKQR
ncbi:hypothetical protein [Ekhidna sp. To15]|uniref:hypothetical protein n=1 Tax=Ekhidna sp. To15 TaxID=3395267 RepID=UPI003F51F26F